MAIVESYNTAIITSKNDVDDDERFQIAVKHGIYLVLVLETQETNMLFFSEVWMSFPFKRSIFAALVLSFAVEMMFVPFLFFSRKLLERSAKKRRIVTHLLCVWTDIVFAKIVLETASTAERVSLGLHSFAFLFKHEYAQLLSTVDSDRLS